MEQKTTAGEIVSLLRRELESFSPATQLAEIGEIVQVGDGIAQVYGISDVMSGELVTIEIPGAVEVTGIALNLGNDATGVVLLDDAQHVKEGQTVRRTRQVASVPVGEALLGRVIDPLGRPIDGDGPIASTATMPIERNAPGIVDRKNVDEPLFTGIKAIDALVPIGRGQRELIIGDRRTGKTAIAVDAIINQVVNCKEQPMYCFYVAIGQKQSSVVQLVEKLRAHGAMANTTVVCATASDPAPLQYIAPYAACSMAEYFRDSSRHALIIYDDLTKQAQAYRQLSLLLRRPPGREAYPGDIFYVHSRLLERAAKLSEKLGGGSLTALPIIETQAGDISAYIPTNVVSITDGQIYLESNLFNAGLRPAINAGLSVSRVGGSAQNKAMKQIAGTMRLDLAQYRELASFSQFSSDLDAATKAQISRGERLTEILKQRQYHPQDIMHQVMIMFAGTHGYLDRYPVNKVAAYERHLHLFLESKYRDFMDRLRASRSFTPEISEAAKEVLNDFAGMFDPNMSVEQIDEGLTLGMAMAISQAKNVSRREILQMIERATAQELKTPSLDRELNTIYQDQEKNSGTPDNRFSQVVDTCTILDITEPLSLEQLFRMAATSLGEELSVEPQTVFDRLMEREKSSSTALTPLFAVPHIMIDGERKFALRIVRCVPGVHFTSAAPEVHAIFFLIGTIDERTTHLQALAGIAQVVNTPEFAQKWMQAGGAEELRSLFSRKQHTENH
ncbi:MAG: F0F1 ATP synthase subunit alpha [Chitinispirillaceae bacterium]|nr:F0F1 ATP synthase subunit alpha [Chitinispirillaceae bacterium]